jgi:starch-binding outer membrane protein SusE/F
MRRLINLSFMVISAITAFTSCKKDERTLDLNVNPVSVLGAPADQASISLQPATGASMVFTWNATQAADGDMVLYEVAFDKADGDFSKPVYKALSDGGGVQAQATVTQKDLNKIASLAGIQSSSTGKLKWTVLVSKATNLVTASVSHTLQVTRPAGFAVPPATLYITGTATEAGDDVTKAIALKQTSDGVFELYTSLKPGTYQLTDKQSASGTKYYLDANGIIQQGNSTSTVTAATQPYRLTYDFSVATSNIVGIQSLGLYVSAYATETGQLSYIGNGTWEAAKTPVTFYQFSWGRDDRYKFILHTAKGLEYYGSENVNNDPPAGKPADYFYLLPVTNDQWNNTYKFPPAADTHNVKVDAYFQATGPYTHTVTAFN